MRKETKIGILAVLALVGFIWGYKFLKGQNLFSSSQVFYAFYSNVDNLPTSSPVLINGLEVGMVTRQFLDENHPERIIIEFDVLKENNVPKPTKKNTPKIANGTLILFIIYLLDLLLCPL